MVERRWFPDMHTYIIEGDAFNNMMIFRLIVDKEDGKFYRDCVHVALEPYYGIQYRLFFMGYRPTREQVMYTCENILQAELDIQDKVNKRKAGLKHVKQR